MARRKQTHSIGLVRLPPSKGPADLAFDWSQYVPGSWAGDLAQEIETYARKLQDLLRNEGKYVLIKEDSIQGIFETRAEATEEAVRKFKHQPVLIKQIRRLQPIAEILGADL